MNQLDEVIKKALELKMSAKNSKKFGVFDEAENDATKAIVLLEQYKTQQQQLPETDRQKIDAELADCCGVLGGVYKSWALDLENEIMRKEKFQLSFDAYKKGYQLEQESGKANSYNMLNMCLGRVFLDPSILKINMDHVDKVRFVSQLQRAEEIIIEQLSANRKNDVWALADLALVHVLLEKEDPISAYSRVIDQGPLYDTYVSILSTLEPLSMLDTSVKSNLEAAISFLQKHMNK